MQAVVQALKRLEDRALLMLGRAVVRATNEKTLRVVQLGIFADELMDDVEHFEPYGFTFRPHGGAEALVAFVGGNRDHPILLTTPDRRYRPTDIKEGEGCIYHSEGHRIELRENGLIRLISGDVKMDLDASGVVFTVPAGGFNINEVGV